MSVDEQLSRFDELWRETSNSWPPPGFSSLVHSQKYWSIVTSLNQEAWQNISDIMAQISRRWYWNVCYTIPQLHITISSLGPAQHWQDKQAELQSILHSLVAGEQPIEIDLHGLNILRNTIVIQAIHRNDKLKTLVDRLNTGIARTSPDMNMQTGIHNELWWASIVRLYKPIPNELFAFVSSFRKTFFVSTLIHSVELVETNKTLELAKPRFYIPANLPILPESLAGLSLDRSRRYIKAIR